MQEGLLKTVVDSIVRSGMVQGATEGSAPAHFVLPSGRHACMWLATDLLQSQPEDLAELCRHLAHEQTGGTEALRRLKIAAVVSPARMDSLGFAYQLAQVLSAYKPKARCVYAQKDPAGATFINLRFREYIEGQRVLVVDPVLTTGETARNTAELVRQYGGNVCAVATIINRGDGERLMDATSLGVPQLTSLVTRGDLEPHLGRHAFHTWENEDSCLLCHTGVPIRTDFGAGAEFLAQKSI